MNIKESVIKEIMNRPKQITCRYSNDELEAMIRKNYYDYKTVASDFAFDIERFEDEGIPKDELYDLYFEIYTERYYSEGRNYYYRFHIGRPYKKKIQELFPITESPSLETTIAYKNILETCVYLCRKINPNDGIFHAEVGIALTSDIETIFGSQYSKRIEDNLYLIDYSKLSFDLNLKRHYTRFIYAPCTLLLVI